jgi:hypothetical protein
VGIVRRRDAGTDVEELPDAGLACQIAYGPVEERAVGPLRDHEVGIGLDCPLPRLPIGGEIVLPAGRLITHSASNHTLATDMATSGY